MDKQTIRNGVYDPGRVKREQTVHSFVMLIEKVWRTFNWYDLDDNVHSSNLPMCENARLSDYLAKLFRIGSCPSFKLLRWTSFIALFSHPTNMAGFSYNTHEGDTFEDDFLLCCGLFYVTTAAKFFSCYFFVVCLLISGLNFLAFGFDQTWFSIFCVFFTVYSLATVYGVFLEKKIFLIPFIFVQGLLAAIVFICAAAFAFLGIATNAIQQHHTDSRPLRDLYLQYELDPDDEITQTVASWSVLVILLVILGISVFSWWVIYNTYRIYASRDRANQAGYQQGLPTTERL
ncbi:unnamed protein product [Cylicocyclus nassatus]|uniref:Uncharacterized protein n=1 Tax=Cylicocyclus nassatus TaxID=53992 RepID=A0AA36HGR1_CYLNA|nr:unnamed protein product [Cylicocyclus nassatus]